MRPETLPQTDGAAIACDRAYQQPAPGTARQRHSRHREDGGRTFVFNFSRVELRLPLVAQAIEANRGFAEGYRRANSAREAGRPGADVRADPDRLLQVVTNLLSNAIKFSPPDREVVVAIEKGADTGPHYGA
jgi:signal transduction histidine kinase